MDILVIHALNALLYASVLFLIAGGLSLIYGCLLYTSPSPRDS